MSNSFLEVNEVLACDIVYEEHSLFWVYPGDAQGLQECKVNVPLLFALEQVDQGIRHKTSMPSAGHGDNTSQIARFRSQQCVLNGTKRVFTGGLLWRRSAMASAIGIGPGGGVGVGVGTGLRTVNRSMADAKNVKYSSRLGDMPAPSISHTSPSDCCRT